MLFFRFITVAWLGVVGLCEVSSARAHDIETENWIYHQGRAVDQQGLEHQVCSTHVDQVVFCFEFLWQRGYQELWVTVHFPDETGQTFADGMASDFWVDGRIHGGIYREEIMGGINIQLDIDRFLGANRAEYYHYGGTWLFFREVVSLPDRYPLNPKNLFHKLTHARHLRLVHHLEGGKTFETEYDLDGLASLLTAAFEEAAAMEHKYGKKPAAE